MSRIIPPLWGAAGAAAGVETAEGAGAGAGAARAGAGAGGGAARIGAAVVRGGDRDTGDADRRELNPLLRGMIWFLFW